MDPVTETVIILAGLLLLGVLGEYIFVRTRVPDMVWLVGAGILVGPVFGLVAPELLKPAIPYFGAIALTVILSGGAFRLRIAEVVAAAPRGLSLGLAGFVLSVAAICLFLWAATEIGIVKRAAPLVWVLVGVIVSGTSSIVIMPTMAMGGVQPRVARMLEVESAATDALVVVIAMVLIDLLVSGYMELSRPVVALARELGVGVAVGLCAAAVLTPGIPYLRDKPHGYTLFLGSMLALYAIAQTVRGNGAMAVLTASLLLGNAASIVPRLFPGAQGHVFAASQTAGVMQDQMSFLIKAFFFFLMGLMFPTDLRLIALAAVGTLFLLAFRIPAVLLATRRLDLGGKEFWLLAVAMPRGLAAGVLATLPVYYGVPGVENLAQTIFALIVFTILVFAIGFAVVGRMGDAAEPPP